MGLEQCLALRVVFAGEPVVMPSRAIGFQNELLGGPAEVRDHPATGERQGNI